MRMRLMTRNMVRLAVAGVAVVSVAACESPEERRARQEAVSRTRVATEAARASRAAAEPRNSTWTGAQLVKRLVDAGLAPQRRDSVRGQPWMGVPVLAFQLGAATIDAYVYHDSVARRAVVAKLDPLTFAPRGLASPWGVPRELVENNNMVAVVVGGTDRQRERVATALAAGLGAP